jgi:hypothetical protein
MIYIFHDMSKAQQQAEAIPDPKQIWWDIDRIVVRTGTDIQIPPSPPGE